MGVGVIALVIEFSSLDSAVFALSPSRIDRFRSKQLRRPVKASVGVGASTPYGTISDAVKYDGHASIPREDTGLSAG